MECDKYDPLSLQICAGLDHRRIWDDLNQLIGAEPVMSCFEKPPFAATNRCHRRVAAAWLEREVGIEVNELGPERR